MNDAILTFVLRRIQKNGAIPEAVSILDFDYRGAGFVDSIGIMKFVLDIEAEFGIEISDADMEDRAFSTVGGLVSIIERRLQQRRPG
ncbi:MAG: hypothetical protein EKK46_02125 [Rhodocyclaceae bacterium]|nr:MAG: hypothetical protein EKK46_02125 [Rhodocyclaceae bacterium]